MHCLSPTTTENNLKSRFPYSWSVSLAKSTVWWSEWGLSLDTDVNPRPQTPCAAAELLDRTSLSCSKAIPASPGRIQDTHRVEKTVKDKPNAGPMLDQRLRRWFSIDTGWMRCMPGISMIRGVCGERPWRPQDMRSHLTRSLPGLHLHTWH